jgi:hypothetical protein
LDTKQEDVVVEAAVVEKKVAKKATGFFNPDAAHCVVHGCPGTAYMQKGKYFNAAGKPVKGPV